MSDLWDWGYIYIVSVFSRTLPNRKNIFDSVGNFDTISEVFSRIARLSFAFKLAYFFRVLYIYIILYSVFIYHNRPCLYHSVVIVKFITFPRQFLKYSVELFSWLLCVGFPQDSVLFRPPKNSTL